MNLDWLYEDKCKGCLFLQEDNIMGATCHWCKFKNEQINVDKVSQCEHKFTLKEAKQYQRFIEILKRTFIEIKILGDLEILSFNNNVEIGKYLTNEEKEFITEVLCNDTR